MAGGTKLSTSVFLKNFAYIPSVSPRTRICCLILAEHSMFCILTLDLACLAFLSMRRGACMESLAFVSSATCQVSNVLGACMITMDTTGVITCTNVSGACMIMHPHKSHTARNWQFPSKSTITINQTKPKRYI